MLVLDGGLGHLLKTLYPSDAVTPAGEAVFLGGAVLASRNPQAVTAAHAAFIDAGADVIAAATFGCVPTALARAGVADGDLEALVAAAVGAARTAADASPRKVTVAASLGPLGECYVPWCDDSNREAGVQTYARLARAAVGAGADVLFIETAASSNDAAAAVRGASTASTPVWVSWTVDDSRGATTRGGDAVSDAAAAAIAAARASGAPPPAVLGVNCAEPGAIEAGVVALAAAGVTNIAAYGNAFAATTGGWLASRGGSENGTAVAGDAGGLPATVSPAAFGAAARRWMDAGATVVGGCCGAGPAHIEAVRAVVDEAVGG